MPRNHPTTSKATPDLHAPIVLPYRTAVGRQVQLDAHAAAQLRFREVHVREPFTLQDAGGHYLRAGLLSLGEKGGEARVFEAMAQSPESPVRLALFCAVLARQRMLFVAQKATELGVVLVQPMITEHSVQADGLAHEKAHAWPRQAIRAVSQCRRAIVPRVPPALPLAEALATPAWTDAESRYYLDDRADESVKLLRGPVSVCLAVGPEGGWSDAERLLLRESGARPLVLGGRVLRAETAVVAALVLAQHRLGDLKT